MAYFRCGRRRRPPHVGGSCGYRKSNRILVVLQVVVFIWGYKTLHRKRNQHVTKFYKAPETWAYFFWNDGLRKRKWIWGLGFRVSEIKVIVNRNKRINKFNLVVLQVSCEKDDTGQTDNWVYTFFYGKANQNVNYELYFSVHKTKI